ncbi:mas-related G-protein coupled receptor member H-like isoform X2 [Pyxicephalus adspersus]
MMMNDSKMEFTNDSEEINGTVDDEPSNGRSAYIMPLTVFSLAMCFLGLLGNGTVFWILCFKMKRNHFTIYILNLAVADFTYLLGLWLWMVYTFCVLNGVRSPATVEGYIAFFMGLVYNFGFNTSIYLLMLIALERCLAVLYPFWYQCYRPNTLSVYLSITSWLLSVLVTGLENLLCTGNQQYQAPGSQSCTNVYFFTSALYLIVLLIMVTSSLTLLFKIQTASKQCHPPKVYIVIIICVTIFLISVVPARILGLLIYFNVLQSKPFLVAFFFITSLCSAFNCSANPYIYMAVGRRGKLKTEKGSIKQMLEKVFKDATETENTTKNTYIIKDSWETKYNMPIPE